MVREYTPDSAREALRSCLADINIFVGKWGRSRSRRAKTALKAVWDRVRPHIITLSPDIREARQNLEFIDLLSRAFVRNAEVLIALIAKLIGQGPILQNERPNEEGSVYPLRGGKSVPVPRGFGAQLQDAMGSRGHTQGDACASMVDARQREMDPKTLRRLLLERGSFHQETIKRARAYRRVS
jgi:hypothetical protein